MLDVGCGRRPYESLFRSRVDSYIGLDWPVHATPSTPDIIADALRLPLAGESADTVLATELMEHLPSPTAFLQEIHRVLRPGGVAIVSVPFLEPVHEAPRDYYRFTPFSLRILFDQCGFVVSELWSRGGWWSVVVGSLLNQRVYDAANPISPDGSRSRPILGAVALPLCAGLQMVSYAFDKLGESSRYTLGYTVVATRRGTA